LTEAAERTCDNCASALVGAYCHECGAPNLALNQRSVRSLMGVLAETLTSVEHSKVLRTLGALLFRPGMLTREYFTGRRIRYIRPLTLCLTILALHLFAYSATNRTTIFDIAKTAAMSNEFGRSTGAGAQESMTQLIGQAAARQGVSVAAVEERIDNRWARNVSLFQIPLILIFAAVLQLAYLRSGRFAVEHFTFSTHYISFQVLFQVLMWPFYYWAGINLSGEAVGVAVVTTAISVVYLCAAIRTFYEDSLKQALIRGPLLYLGYLIVYALTYQVAMIFALGSGLA
jgi:hypothetical protein